jgi:hypothetical protein
MINERVLRGIVREILIVEGMKTAGDLPDTVKIAVRSNVKGGFDVFFSGASGNPAFEEKLRPQGSLLIVKPAPEVGNCGGALEVAASDVDDGWGPLLYDVAMAVATLKAGGLMAGHDGITRDAKGVWDYYMKNRSDVDKHQMGSLEDGGDDSCDQFIANHMDGDWRTSSLSKRYTRKNASEFLTKLENGGKLIYV